MPGYVAFSFKVDRARFSRGRLITNGTVSFIVSKDRRNRISQALQALSKHGYKLGIRIKRGQEIERRGFRGDFGRLELRQDRKVTRELIQTFGQDAGERWVGFKAEGNQLRLKPKRGEGNTMSFATSFALTNFRSEPQILPVVYGYSHQSFREHYILGVRILTKKRPFAEVHVRAVN